MNIYRDMPPIDRVLDPDVWDDRLLWIVHYQPMDFLVYYAGFNGSKLLMIGVN